MVDKLKKFFARLAARKINSPPTRKVKISDPPTRKVEISDPPTRKVEISDPPIVEKKFVPKPTREEKACLICGKNFVPRERRQKYCSDKCRCAAYLAKKRHAPKKVKCPQCGEEFVPHAGRQKYCSVECREKFRLQHQKNQGEQNAQGLYEKTCPVCGKIFSTEWRHKKYCSDACRQKFILDRRREKREAEAALEGRIISNETQCLVCGKTFSKNSASQLFCSVECRKKHQATRQSAEKTAPEKKKKKSLFQWQQEAAQCGLSYGKYRAAVDCFGKTFDELLAEKNAEPRF